MAARPPSTFIQLTHPTPLEDQLLRPFSGTVTVMQPPPTILSSIIDELWCRLQTGDPSLSLEIYAKPDSLTAIDGTLHATCAGDLIQRDHLTIYQLPHTIKTGVSWATDGTTGLTYLYRNDSVHILTATEETYDHPTIQETTVWTAPDESLTSVLDDFEDTFGDASTYRTLLRTVLNPVTPFTADHDDLLLLAGANEQLPLVQLKNWVEQIGISSRSTLNRKKNRLIDDDILSITREPQVTGRPRQILNIPNHLPNDHEYTELLQSKHTTPTPTSD